MNYLAIPQHGPQNKLTKQYNHGHKISKRFTQAVIATPKLSHIRSNRRYIAIFASFFAFTQPFPQPALVHITVVSLANLHKRPEALARYYETSYWQAKWVKKLRWKTIELPPPVPPWARHRSQYAFIQNKSLVRQRKKSAKLTSCHHDHSVSVR